MKVGIFVTSQNPLGVDMVAARDEQFAMARLTRDRSPRRSVSGGRARR